MRQYQTALRMAGKLSRALGTRHTAVGLDDSLRLTAEELRTYGVRVPDRNFLVQGLRHDRHKQHFPWR